MILFISIPLQLPQSVLPFLMVLAKNLEAPYRTWPFRTSVLSVFSLHSVLRSFIKAQSRMNLHAQLCFPVSPLESALPRLAGSVHPKRLPERLSLLESALPKNGGALLDVQPSTCDFVPNVTNSEGGIPFLRRSRLGDGLSSDSFNISLLHCIHVSCLPVVVPLEPHGKRSLFLLSSYCYWTLSLPPRGVEYTSILVHFRSLAACSALRALLLTFASLDSRLARDPYGRFEPVDGRSSLFTDHRTRITGHDRGRITLFASRTSYRAKVSVIRRVMGV